MAGKTRSAGAAASPMPRLPIKISATRDFPYGCGSQVFSNPKTPSGLTEQIRVSKSENHHDAMEEEEDVCDFEKLVAIKRRNVFAIRDFPVVAVKNAGDSCDFDKFVATRRRRRRRVWAARDFPGGGLWRGFAMQGGDLDTGGSTPVDHGEEDAEDKVPLSVRRRRLEEQSISNLIKFKARIRATPNPSA